MAVVATWRPDAERQKSPAGASRDTRPRRPSHSPPARNHPRQSPIALTATTFAPLTQRESKSLILFNNGSPPLGTNRIDKLDKTPFSVDISFHGVRATYAP